MTRDELLELLLIERHTPLPRPPQPEPRLADMPAMAVDVDDSEVTTKRRRQELYEATGRDGWLTNYDTEGAA